MPYIGQRPSKGDENNFKILDDISSYTLTFDGTDASVVSAANDTITSLNHRFVQGQRVTYHNGGGNNIGGLSGTAYFIIKEDHNTIKLASTASNASNGIAVNITGVASSGSSHTLNLTFDGTNTKFKATHTNGQKAKITRSAQLVISMNGVIQQPHDTATPSTGFGFDLDGTIVFSQAPISTDVFWAHVLTNNNVTFDISDNDIDNFTGNGSTVSFNLSKSPPDNRNVLVTLDGVVQYPNDPDGTARSYNVVENVLTFTTAPASGVEIQVRHIGFAGSTSGGGSGGVTSFYGRTGAVVLKSTDNITVNDAAITGNATVTGNLTVNGTTTTLDTQLVEVDKIEVETAGTNVAVAVTHNGTGDLIRLYDGTSQVVTVDDEGKVGIGTANPTQNLHILGSSTSTVLIRASTLNGTAKLQLQDSLGRDNFIAAEGADNLVFAADEGNAGAGSYMRFKVDGSEKVRITSAGSVGINTTVDAATKLQVQSDGTSTTVGGNIVARFQSNGSGRDATIQLSDNVAHSATISMLSSALVFEQSGTETLRIDSSGRVLIGTDSSLNQYGSQSHLQVAGTSYDSSTIALRREQNNANPPGIIFAKSRSGTLGGNTIVQDDDQIGSLIFTAADGNDLTTVGAQIKVEVDGTPASNNIPGRIVFQTGGTAASNERLRITSTGHLGVGDDSPDTRLSVKAASGTDVVGKFTSTDANAWIQFRDNTTTDTAVMVGANGDNLLFRAGSNTRVRIHSTGQVTIGAIAATSSASGILHTKVSNTTSPVVFENDTENADVVIRTTGSNKHSVLGFGDGADNFIGNIDYDHQNNAMVFDTNGGERLNISSAGVVTQVETGTGNGMGGIRASTASAGGNAGFGFITGGTQRFALVTIGSAGSEALRVYDNNNSAERLRIDSSGHMGLGVTPNANWPTNNDFKALQIGTGACVFGRGSGDEDRGGMAVNWYSTGSANKYIGNGNAARVYLADGNMYFSNAPTNSSGANAAMTLTDRLLITSTGRLKVNHTSTSSKLDDTWLSIYDANSDSSANDPAGISKNYAMISLHNYGTGNTGDATGIGFGSGSGFNYVKGSIAFARSGSYGTGDLVFLTNNDQDATMVNDTDEKLRITRTGIHKITTPGNIADGTYFSTLTINNTGSSTWSRIRFDRSGVARWGLSLRTDDKFAITNLYTDGSSGSPNDNTFVIDNQGKIGINEGTPDRELHISSATNGGVLRFTNTDTTITNGTICGMIEFEQRDSNTPGVSATIRSELTDTTNGACAMYFQTGTPSTIGTRLTINSSGNIDMSGYLKAKPSPGNGDNQLAMGRHYTWNASNLSPSIGSGSSGWYPIMDISDGQYLFLIGTNAHNSATCLVCNGYDPSAVSRINVLNCVRNNNGQYMNIQQIRVLNNGVVEVYLHADTESYFGMYIQMISNKEMPNFYSTLTKNTGSPTVDDGKNFNTYSSSVGAGLMHVENLRVDGTISKGTDNFEIPHPLPSKKDTHHLFHSMIEGPQCDNIYRGKVTLSSGAATVNLDTVSNMTEGTFVLLNRDVQCFTTNETGWGAIKGSVSGNILTISAQDGSSTDTISWMVVGERQDDAVKKSNSTDSDGHLVVERELDSNVGLVTGATSPYD